jgi:hypothetical protein
MIDIDPGGAFVATQAGVRAYERGWTHRWPLLRWRRSSNLAVTKGAIKMFGRVLPREVERRRTSVNNF